MQLAGVTIEQAEKTMARAMLVGLLISILQATGIAALMSLVTANNVSSGIKAGLLAWFFFALPQLMYHWNYAAAPFELLQIDAAYALTGYTMMGVVIAVLKK